MKKYSEEVKNIKSYHYLHCDNCETTYIDDLFYLPVNKICINCHRILHKVYSENKLTEEQVKKIIERYKIKNKLQINRSGLIH